MTQATPDTSGAARGIFITFEGGEGAGKSTHIRFLSSKLREHDREVVCLREPGGTDIGEQLRAVVLDPAHGAMVDEAELLIYEAARAQLVAEVIKPALERGAVVLCDRFTDSTVAYQSCGRGLDRALVDRVNAFACQGLDPDRTILMATGGSAKRGLARATHRFGADRLEQAGEEFHTRVNEGFQDIARDNCERIRIVESASRKSDTAKAVFRALTDLFPWMEEAIGDDAYFASLDARRPRKGSRNAGAPASSQGSGRAGGAKQASRGSGGRTGRNDNRHPGHNDSGRPGHSGGHQERGKGRTPGSRDKGHQQ
ncbi:MAG: dTMP kinase [Gordonibacter sp.]